MISNPIPVISAGTSPEEVEAVDCTVDSFETRRQLEELVANGWPIAELARRLDVARRDLWLALERDQVSSALSAAVTGLHNELRYAWPPEETHREKIIATKTRKYAYARGWVPTLIPPQRSGAMGGAPISLPAPTDEPEEWRADALCAQTDPEAFFPEKGGSNREAKRICRGCGVQSKCLSYALEHDERYGIWGGLSERERRSLQRRIR